MMIDDNLLPVVELIRLEENDHYGTFGIWRVNKRIFCATLEPRDEENAPFVSSIPEQQYICERKPTQLDSVSRLGLDETFEVMRVPGRYSIKIHPGNVIKHTQGCILLGSYHEKLKDRIVNSGQTFLRFMALMEPYDRFHLTVKKFY